MTASTEQATPDLEILHILIYRLLYNTMATMGAELPSLHVPLHGDCFLDLEASLHYFIQA